MRMLLFYISMYKIICDIYKNRTQKNQSVVRNVLTIGMLALPWHPVAVGAIIKRHIEGGWDL